MRLVPLIAAFALLAGAAAAQTTDTAPAPKPHHHHHHKATAASGTGERPIDNGPTSPDSDKAYQGGGVVLQGAPGAPAPTPQATPPGQAPDGSVPR